MNLLNTNLRKLTDHATQFANDSFSVAMVYDEDLAVNHFSSPDIEEKRRREKARRVRGWGDRRCLKPVEVVVVQAGSE